MTTHNRRSLMPATRNLLWDTLLFAGSLLALSPRLTGMTLHEWLSASLGLGILIHLLWHWPWIAAVMRRLFSRLAGSARLNLVLNLVLFVVFTISLLSGLMISREILPALGLRTEWGGVWRMLHTQSSDLVLVLVGLHLALHWKWIFRRLRHLFWWGTAADAPRLDLSVPAAAPVAVREEVRR